MYKSNQGQFRFHVDFVYTKGLDELQNKFFFFINQGQFNKLVMQNVMLTKKKKKKKDIK